MKTANKTMRRKSSKTGTTRAAGVLVVGVLIIAFNMTSDQGWGSTTVNAAKVVTYPAPAGKKNRVNSRNPRLTISSCLCAFAAKNYDP